MKNAITSATQLNIKAQLGVRMFAFMWVAAACSILAWLIQMGMCCCCASRRDVRRGKKTGSKKAWEGSAVVDGREEGTEVPEKGGKRKGLPMFKRNKRA